MNYPLISEYIEAIKSAEDNFDKLNSLRPVLDASGNPIMTSGNFAVVFKMKDMQSGKFYAVKCFLKDQKDRAENYKLISEELSTVISSYLIHFKYYDKEIFVDTNNSSESEFPILLMDWVDGVTLDKYIRQNLDDQFELRMLAYRFSCLAMWLIPQPFAHGDIKPDNIIVRDDGSLVLIDYDGMYVPAMKGQKARELGSPDFRHPARTENDFNEHIDDFSLVSMLLSLKVISEKPSLLEKYGTSDRLLFSESDYRNLNNCQLLKDLYPSSDHDINMLISLFNIALNQGNLSRVSFNLLSLKNPISLEMLRSEVKSEDMDNAWEDEYGVLYSSDGMKLLKANCVLNRYVVREGVKIICDEAFWRCDKLKDVHFPNSLEIIGKSAFGGCENLEIIGECNFLKVIKEDAFGGCFHLRDFEFSDNLLIIGKGAFRSCTSLTRINIPKGITIIEEHTFSWCKKLKEVAFSKNVKEIGDAAFTHCI